jgi:hypothetical protein
VADRRQIIVLGYRGTPRSMARIWSLPSGMNVKKIYSVNGSRDLIGQRAIHCGGSNHIKYRVFTDLPSYPSMSREWEWLSSERHSRDIFTGNSTERKMDHVMAWRR